MTLEPQNEGRQVDERVAYWIDLADYDLETGRAMLATQRYLYVGFMCHQVVEKLLKAIYSRVKRETPPFTHNLNLLAGECGLDTVLGDQRKDLLDILDPLNIKARYPTVKARLLETLTHERCQDILARTEEFSKWIKQRL